MATKDDFSQLAYEPVAGSVVGVRLFGLSPSPPERAFPTTPLRLTGVTYRTTWHPGTNTATCGSGALARAAGRLRAAVTGTEPPAGPTADEEAEHLLDPECGCGFWAYTARPGDKVDLVYGTNGHPVIGVVEAWGRMVIGPRGFRAQHARILALAFPDVTTPDAAALLREWTSELQFHVRKTLRGSGFLRTPGPPVPQFPWGGNAAHQARVAASYPDVAIFPDEPSMLAEYPLSDLSGLLEGGES